jgi:hypothetical protein
MARTISRLSSLAGGSALLSMFFPIPQWLALAELIVLIALWVFLIVAWRIEVKQ